VKDDINIDGIWISDVYPNPASNNINITIKTEQPCIITFNLIGLDGKVIKTVTANSAIKGQRTVSFDVSDISSGNYYVGIFSNKTKFAFKVKIVK
jgi:ribosomal protein S3